MASQFTSSFGDIAIAVGLGEEFKLFHAALQQVLDKRKQDTAASFTRLGATVNYSYWEVQLIPQTEDIENAFVQLGSSFNNAEGKKWWAFWETNDEVKFLNALRAIKPKEDGQVPAKPKAKVYSEKPVKFNPVTEKTKQPKVVPLDQAGEILRYMLSNKSFVKVLPDSDRQWRFVKNGKVLYSFWFKFALGGWNYEPLIYENETDFKWGDRVKLDTLEQLKKLING